MRLGRRGCILFMGCGTLAVVLCVVSFIAITIARRPHPTTDPTGPRIVYALTNLPLGIDPHINADVDLGIVLRSVYDTLVYRDPQTKAFVPGLADHWETTADGLTYTFHLKSGVKFHDGTPFTADAVGRTLNRITNPTTKSQKSLALLGPYERFNIVDPLTIQIILKTPYAPLLDSFSQVYLGIASPKALQDYDLLRYQYHQVGTGPYKMIDYVPGDHITLRRNHDYAWGPIFYRAPDATSVEEIEFHFYTDPTTHAQLLQDGTVQVMSDLSSDDASRLARVGDLRVIPQPIPGQPLQFFFNLKQVPTDKLELRQALIESINRQNIVDSVFREFSTIAYGPLSTTMLYYDQKIKTTYTYNLTDAQKLFTKAGYAIDPVDKKLKSNGTPLRLIILVSPYGSIPQVAQKLQSQWLALGIDVELKPVPSKAALDAAVKAGNYNLIAAYDFGLDPGLLNVYFHTGSALNYAHYSDSKLDIQLDKGITVLTSQERQIAYSAIQTTIMAQALILPIREYINLCGVSIDVDGLAYDATGWYPLLPNLKVTGSRTATPTFTSPAN